MVFRSKDAVEAGADWHNAIIDAIRGSRFCLSLLTPNSVYKSWVLYESGAAYALYRKRAGSLIALCASGITPALVPDPFQRLQACSLHRPTEVQNLLRRLATTLGRNFHPLNEKVDALARIGDFTEGWEAVQLGRVAMRSGSSPLRFDRALVVAKEHVFLAGQNLNFVATSKECSKAILEFLHAGQGRKVDILFCHPSNKAAIKVWTDVNPSLPSTGYTHRDQLGIACRRFKTILEEATVKGIHGLSVKVLTLVPYGVTAVDPELKSGIMAVQPIVHHAPKAADRPQFLITRAGNPQAFSHYWTNLSQAFRDGTDLREVLCPESGKARDHEGA